MAQDNLNYMIYMLNRMDIDQDKTVTTPELEQYRFLMNTYCMNEFGRYIDPGNPRDISLTTLFNYACLNGNEPLIKWFIDNGYRPIQQCIINALNNKHINVVKYLMPKYIDFDVRYNRFSNSVTKQYLQYLTYEHFIQYITTDNIELAKVYIENGMIITSQLVTQCIINEYYLITEYLLSKSNEKLLDIISPEYKDKYLYRDEVKVDDKIYQNISSVIFNKKIKSLYHNFNINDHIKTTEQSIVKFKQPPKSFDSKLWYGYYRFVINLYIMNKYSSILYDVSAIQTITLEYYMKNKDHILYRDNKYSIHILYDSHKNCYVKIGLEFNRLTELLSTSISQLTDDDVFYLYRVIDYLRNKVKLKTKPKQFDKYSLTVTLKKITIETCKSLAEQILKISGPCKSIGLTHNRDVNGRSLLTGQIDIVCSSYNVKFHLDYDETAINTHHVRNCLLYSVLNLKPTLLVYPLSGTIHRVENPLAVQSLQSELLSI
jgi:hypothetical protein